MTHIYKPGDEVICIDDKRNHELRKGAVYKVIGTLIVDVGESDTCYRLVLEGYAGSKFFAKRFKPVNRNPLDIIDALPVGV
jgi:hypothetical protein